MTNHIRNEDGNYGPTTNGNYYHSKADHRKSSKPSKHKTRWAIEEGQEFYVFKIADEPKERWFCDENNCLFSLVDDCKQVLGDGGERLAKFPQPNSSQDPWHGYPIKLTGAESSPGDALLDMLLQSNIISETTMRRIERKKI